MRFFVIFNSKIPCFSREGPLWKPLTFSEGPLHMPPILKPCAAHIYQFHIYVPPPPHTHTHGINAYNTEGINP